MFIEPIPEMLQKSGLKLMMNADHQKLDDATMELIRQEIGCVITKYVVIEPENIEIKVMLKDYKKRE
ncbi:MAG: cell division topological specificity factor MinE [Roseburia intestinalis]